MNMRSGPEGYATGVGEVIRGYRLYLGLSRNAMAIKLGVAFRSYERMEDGTRDCPPGFFDTLRAVVRDFEYAVERVLDDPPGAPIVHPGEDNEWWRSIVARAAISSSRITPVLRDENAAPTEVV